MRLAGGLVTRALVGMAVGVVAVGRSWEASALDDRAMLAIYPVDGGKPVTVPGAQGDDAALTWTRDGTRLYVQETRFQPQARVSLLNVRTGERKLWRTLAPREVGRPVR